MHLFSSGVCASDMLMRSFWGVLLVLTRLSHMSGGRRSVDWSKIASAGMTMKSDSVPCVSLTSGWWAQASALRAGMSKGRGLMASVQNWCAVTSAALDWPKLVIWPPGVLEFGKGPNSSVRRTTKINSPENGKREGQCIEAINAMALPLPSLGASLWLSLKMPCLGIT